MTERPNMFLWLSSYSFGLVYSPLNSDACRKICLLVTLKDTYMSYRFVSPVENATVQVCCSPNQRHNVLTQICVKIGPIFPKMEIFRLFRFFFGLFFFCWGCCMMSPPMTFVMHSYHSCTLQMLRFRISTNQCWKKNRKTKVSFLFRSLNFGFQLNMWKLASYLEF